MRNKVRLVLLFAFLLFFTVSNAIDVTNCTNISYSDSYTLINNVSGAPVDAGAVPYTGVACIYIQSDNVTFDCNGYNITNNGT